jgi:hopanoid-associated phosphorylase
MIVVVGLAFEARIAAGSGLPIICSGDGRNLTPALKEAIADGCSGLISFGVAGGLDPRLKPGTCVVGSAIVTSDIRHETDRHWSQRLLEAMPGAVHGILAGADGPVCTPADKRALNRQTGALAVDTESHVVAQAATGHGLPMVAIRVVADPAHRALPEVALTAIRADGTTDVLAVLRSVMRRPHQLPGLLRTALDARAARATLLRGRRVLKPAHVTAGFRPARTADAAFPEPAQVDLSSAVG